ncbi:FAST kinase domain-containing protein 3, mitochondrial-like [Argopecten irradians]|uniref:FAST kinase domain-containing protein 3, mitochondrial-like n=1 Tax=Argopecten irradians TaxID=31199 RepID=UPI0037137C3D
MALSVSSTMLQISVKQLVKLCSRRLLERNLGIVSASSTSRLVSTNPANERNRKKLYSISRAIAQRADGIHDVPIIMRHIGDKIIQDENYDKLIPELSEGEIIYMERLNECESIGEVLHLLDSHPDTLSSHAAALSLIKLKVLDRQRRDDQKPTGKLFVSKVIMQQLFGIAQRNIDTLSDENLVELARQFLEDNEPESDIKEFILSLIQKKMEDDTLGKYAVFSLTELLQHKKYSDILQDIWLHVTSRYTELDMDDLLKYLDHVPANMDITERLVEIIENHLVRFGWQLGSRGIGKISASLSRLKCKNDTLASSIAKWTLYHIHEIKTDDLMNVLTYFQETDKNNADLIYALEKYISSKGSQVKNELLGQTLDYLCTIRYLSPVIMNSAVTHFLQCKETYTATDLYRILNPFGFFGYQPSKQMAFFQAADEVIPKQFDHFRGADAYKLMCSFLWLDRHSPLLRSLARQKSWSTDPSDKIGAFWCQRALSNNYSLSPMSVLIHHRMHDLRMKDVPLNLSQQNEMTFQIANAALSSLLKYPVINNVRIKSFLIDFMLIVDQYGNEVSRKFPPQSKMFVPEEHSVILIKLQYPEHFCCNTGEPLGEHAMAKKFFDSCKIRYITMCPLKAGIQQTSVEILQMHLYYTLHHFVRFKINPFTGVGKKRLLKLWEASNK